MASVAVKWLVSRRYLGIGLYVISSAQRQALFQDLGIVILPGFLMVIVLASQEFKLDGDNGCVASVPRDCGVLFTALERVPRAPRAPRSASTLM